MPKITFTTEGATGVERAQKALNAAMDEYERRAKAGLDPTEKLSRAAKKLAEQADPQKRYNNRMTELADAVKRGGLSIEDATKLAQRYGDRLDQVGQAGRRSFGPSALSNVAAFVGQYASVAGGVGLVATALRDAAAAGEEAKNSFATAFKDVAQLQEMANAIDNLSFARDVEKAGIADLGTASSLAKQLAASGITGAERDFLVYKIGGEGAVSPENLEPLGAKAKKAQQLLGVKGFDETLQMLFAGADPSDSNPTDFAVAATKYANAFKALGYTPTESVAALGTALKFSDNAEVGGTALQAFAAQVDKRGLNKGTLKDTVLGIKSQIDGGKGAFDVLGETSAVNAYRGLLNNMAFYDEQRGIIGGAAKNDFIGNKPNQLLADPQFAAETTRRKAVGRQAAAQRDEATSVALAQAVVADIVAQQGGNSALNFFGVRADAYAATISGTTDNFLRRRASPQVEGIFEADGTRLSPEVQSRVEEYLRRSAEANERTARAADDTPRGRQE